MLVTFAYAPYRYLDRNASKITLVQHYFCFNIYFQDSANSSSCLWVSAVGKNGDGNTLRLYSCSVVVNEKGRGQYSGCVFMDACGRDEH